MVMLMATCVFTGATQRHVYSSCKHQRHDPDSATDIIASKGPADLHGSQRADLVWQCAGTGVSIESEVVTEHETCVIPSNPPS